MEFWVSYQADELIEAETMEEAEEKMKELLHDRECCFRILDVEEN